VSSVPAGERAHSFYGLRVASRFPLPHPPAREASGEGIEIYPGPASLFQEAARENSLVPGEGGLFHHALCGDGSIYLRWEDLFEFLIFPDIRRIACRQLPGCPAESFQDHLLGPVLSFVLLRRGFEPIHATAVVIGGRAVAFLGNSGLGKSSLGASFLQAGYRLVTDDLLVLREEPPGFLALPGPSRIKLYPEMGKRLLGKRMVGTMMNHRTTKLIFPLHRRQSQRMPLPLQGIYVLAPPAGRRRRVSIRPLSRRRAFMELIRNYFNSVITDAERLRRQFLHSRKIVSEIPIRLLSYPRALDRLPSVREAILADLARGSGS